MAETITSEGRVVRMLSAAYFEKTTNPEGKPARLVKTARRGETISTENLAPGEIERLDQLGALMPEGASATDAFDDRQARLDFYRGQRGDQEALQRSMRRAAEGQRLGDSAGGIVDLSGDAPPPASGSEASVTELADHITAQKLTVDDTVALAENDPDLARRVLEAERLASNDSPRAGVVSGLEKITGD